MIFTTTVTLQEGDSFLYTPDAAAAQVLAALGGNATKDSSTVFISQATSGQAGVPIPVNEPPGLAAQSTQDESDDRE